LYYITVKEWGVMLGVDRVLVALEQNAGAVYVLEKAMTLAAAADADLEVIHVVYESLADLPVQAVEKNQALKTFILQAAETWLEDQLDSARRALQSKTTEQQAGAPGKGLRSIESATIWNKDEWQGIIHAAELGQADLIIKAADSTHQAGLVMRTPSDFNLIRHATVPVMLVKPSAWVKTPIIMAAVDALNEEQFSLGKRVLQEADSLTSILNGELAVVCTYPLLQPWAGTESIGIDFQQLEHDIEKVAHKNIDQLTSAANVSYNYLYIEEGRPAMRLRKLAQETQAEILVMGTVGRTGVKSLVIGNTSETIVQYSDCDVVVVREPQELM
jgi:universal stress protein E